MKRMRFILAVTICAAIAAKPLPAIAADYCEVETYYDDYGNISYKLVVRRCFRHSKIKRVWNGK